MKNFALSQVGTRITKMEGGFVPIVNQGVALTGLK